MVCVTSGERPGRHAGLTSALATQNQALRAQCASLHVRVFAFVLVGVYVCARRAAPAGTSPRRPRSLLCGGPPRDRPRAPLAGSGIVVSACLQPLSLKAPGQRGVLAVAEADELSPRATLVARLLGRSKLSARMIAAQRRAGRGGAAQQTTSRRDTASMPAAHLESADRLDARRVRDLIEVGMHRPARRGAACAGPDAPLTPMVRTPCGACTAASQPLGHARSAYALPQTTLPRAQRQTAQRQRLRARLWAHAVWQAPTRRICRCARACRDATWHAAGGAPH